MAVWHVVAMDELEAPLVLVPERYHPARLMSATSDASRVTVPLGALAALANDALVPAREPPTRRFVQLDTSDAVDGFIRGDTPARPAADIGSAKRLLRAGDVIISRLRPYLRQVGWVDDDLAAHVAQAGTALACSTEFLVLRAAADPARQGDGGPPDTPPDPHDRQSIAFLVPFLLAAGPQRLFAASVEGGHHPRFHRDVLLSLPVPRALVADRVALSQAVAGAVAARRTSERLMRAATATATATASAPSGAAGASASPRGARRRP